MLRCLPGIVQLQHMLACKFHHNIDSADAIIINIGEFKQKYFEGKRNIQSSFNSYNHMVFP